MEQDVPLFEIIYGFKNNNVIGFRESFQDEDSNTNSLCFVEHDKIVSGILSKRRLDVFCGNNETKDIEMRTYWERQEFSFFILKNDVRDIRKKDADVSQCVILSVDSISIFQCIKKKPSLLEFTKKQ